MALRHGCSRWGAGVEITTRARPWSLERETLRRWIVAGALACAALAAPATASATTATAISAGGLHGCAVTNLGAAECWGDNENGQLGDGTTTNTTTPVAVSELNSHITALSAGEFESCALTSEGEAECWGFNGDGQLGDGTTTSTTEPVAVSDLGAGVKEISTGGFHTCAVTSAGAARCWGSGEAGALGDGTTTNTTTPVTVSGLSSGVTAISAGEFDTCALTSAGAVKCWGDDENGQLGNGTTGFTTTPVSVIGLGSGVIAISAGHVHNCALTSAGAARCWGSNDHGQLGDGTTTDASEPVSVVGLSSGVTAISAGNAHTCALTSAGAAKCWGDDEFGQLGDDSLTNTTEPVAVTGLSSGVTAISAGLWDTCAVTSIGAAKCWGDGEVGALGDGTSTSTSKPVEVAGFNSGTCSSTSGTITLSPGLTATPAMQKVKVKATLQGCTGEPFTAATYTATLATTDPVSCSMLDGENESATGAAKFKWTPNAKASTGTLNVLLAETNEGVLSGEVSAGSFAPLRFGAISLKETYTGGDKCGQPEGKKAAKPVKTATFSGSAVGLE
jgi:alpha-tubulin suppressor-like RCC1 family protein